MAVDPRVPEWGNPACGRHATTRVGPTRGTETSKYPEEKKTTVIPRVAASESGGAQTGAVEAVPGLKDGDVDEGQPGERPGKGGRRA